MLSCFGMLLLDDILHRLIHVTCPQVRVLSFVDNWDFLTLDSSCALRHLNLLLEFTKLADLTVDRAKTFGWSTCASVHGAFRTHGVPVKHHAKDLGSHVAFSGQRTNRSLTARLDDLDGLWIKLKASRASYQTKVGALRTVAWPRGLFGVYSAPEGRAVWLKHRPASTQALAFDKPGVNPVVLLGLVGAFADPELIVGLVRTIADAA